MFGNNNNFNNGYLPDGTYISPAMARMGYMPNNIGYPMMNNNMTGGGGNFNNVNPMINQQQQLKKAK